MSSLRHFLQRSAALRLYRDILRECKKMPLEMSQSIRLEARRQFDVDRFENPNPASSQVDFLVSKGQEKLSELRKMLSLTR